MALRKATAAAPAAPRAVVARARVMRIKSLVDNPDVVGKTFQVMPKQTEDVSKLPYFGAMVNPQGTFIINNTITKQGRAETPLYLFHGVDEVNGVLASYVHPELRVKEIKKRTKALEEMLSLQNLGVLAGQMFSYHNKRELGSDPEVFAVNAKGELIPSFEYLGAKGRGNGGAPYWDGYQGEFTVTPMTCMAHFVDGIQRQLLSLDKTLKAHNKDAYITTKNTFDIPAERLKTDDPKYVEFGCRPSLNAYGEEPMQVEGKNVPFRSAGGHLHFSCGKTRIVDIVKSMDRVLGVISVSMFQYYDDPRRRMFYGRAGEYRTPPHGLEYRVLSNAWMAHPGITHFIYELARKCLANGVTGHKMPHWDVTEEEARQCINTCDVGMAQALLKRNEQGLMAILASLPGIHTNPAVVKKWKAIVMDGIDKFLVNPDKLSKAWRLGVGELWQTHSEGKCGNITHTTTWLLDPANKHGMLDW